MITSCAHTFCSVCIRRCLSTEGKCPACRSSDQELKLRFNGAMEEAVAAFVRGREGVLEYARAEKEREVVYVDRERRKRGLEGEGMGDDTPRKRTRASTRSQSQTQSQSTQIPRERLVIEDSEDEEENVLPGMVDQLSCFAPSNKSTEGYTHCPICSREVEISTINAHIDRNCVDPPVHKNSSKANFKPPQHITKPPTNSKPLERLPQVNYSMLKDVPLRKKLTDAGLSAAGSRQLLQQRYSEWITLWNANCDATRPKTKVELKREMDIWERTQGGRALVSAVGGQIRDKDFDGKAWSEKHDGDFQSLIADARRKVGKKVEEADKGEQKEDEQKIAPVPEVVSAGQADMQPSSTPAIGDQKIENGTVSVSAQTEVLPSIPVRDSSQRSRYFQEKDSEEQDIYPPSSQQIVT